MQKTIQNLKWITLSAVLGIAIGGGLIAVNAWTEPTVAPPGGNIGAPINTSATGQSKSGGLLLNTVGATNGLIVQSGNVGIGVINPNAKFHVLGNTFLEGGENGVYGQLNIRTSGIADHDAQLAFTTAKNSRGLYIDDSDSNKMKFYTGYGKGIAGKEVTFDNEGSVGIGTTSPSTGLKLDVEGKVGATEYCDQDGNNCKAITAMGGGTVSAGVFVGYCQQVSTTCQGVIAPAYCSSSLPVGCACPSDYTKTITGQNGGGTTTYYSCVKK